MRGIPIECGISTIAEGIAVRQPDQVTLPIIRERVGEVLLVEEEDLEASVLLLLEVEKTVVEGAGAAGLAAIIKCRRKFTGRKVGVILSGGNIDLMALSSIIKRGLIKSGRLVRLRVELRDVPGALAEITKCIGEVDANIVGVRHQRTFTTVPLQSAEVEFVLQARGHDHVQQIVNTINNAGCRAFSPDGNVRSSSC